MTLRGGIVAAGLLALAACGNVTVNADAGADIDSAPTVDGAPMIDAPPGDPCAGNPTLANFVECLNEAVCGLFEACECFFADQASCDTARFQFYDDVQAPYLAAYFADAVAAGILTYDPVKAGQCLTLLRTPSCGILYGQSDVFETACNPFTGTVQAAGVCFTDLECQVPGSRCEQPACDGSACCPGSCVPPAPLNGDCGANDLCPPGAHCVQPAGGTASCETGEGGSVCVNDSDCDLDHHCVGNLCRPDVASGTLCDRDAQCRGLDRCVGTSLGIGQGSCRAIDTVGAACEDECFGCMYCDRPDPNQLGSCAARKAIDTACADNDECEGFAETQCDPTELTCELRGVPDGQPCVSSFACRFGSFCTTEISGGAMGTCVGPQPNNSVCEDDEHCESGICAGSAPNRTCTGFAGCR